MNKYKIIILDLINEKIRTVDIKSHYDIENVKRKIGRYYYAKVD